MQSDQPQPTKKVFVLVEGHGAYSDRCEYPIAAFTSKNAAWEYADHLPKRRKELMDRFSREDCPKQEANLILLELGVSLHDWEKYVKGRQRDRYRICDPRTPAPQGMYNRLLRGPRSLRLQSE